MLAAPVPDILVTGDGHHAAVRMKDGTMAILRGGAGDYVRQTLVENAGLETGMTALADAPDTRCSSDLCSTTVQKSGKSWHILIARSRNRIDWSELVQACAAADIVIADRRVQRGCHPRWLRLDRARLRETGGVAIYLADMRYRMVNRAGDAHPWIAR